MSTPTLFDLASEFEPIRVDLERMLMDKEIDDQTFLDTLESAAFPLMVKAENTAKLIRNWQVIVDAKKEQAKRLAEQAKTIENRSNRLMSYLLDNLEHAGFESAELDSMTIKIKNNPERVVIDDEDAIPADFKVVKTEERIDKKLVKDGIKSGVIPEGVAHLERTKRLEIK